MTHMTTLSQGVKGGAMRVLMNHIYEYKKGVRRLVLYTFNGIYEKYAIERLEHQQISYFIMPLSNGHVNLFFGRPECLAEVKKFADKPLSALTPEEDFILGALLGYDLSIQSERYVSRKDRGIIQLPQNRLI